ncbi:MAG TPA: efflux RND transporter periplasmic adaptor subunit [Candidatus Cryosericum sp.]|nr:efflux RND transporter periplasmic adaptor subunit [Candidatus Cryosericum sp.]
MAGTSKTRRWLLVAAATLAVASLAWLALRRERAKDEPQYRLQAVDRGDIAMVVTATGTISAVTTVQIGSQVSGIIASLHADFNSPVTKGQLLATLDPTPFQAQVEQRRADLQQAEVQKRNAAITFDRQKQLLAEKLAAQADYDAARAADDGAQAQVDQARATLRQAETNLRYTRIESPIDGVVVDRKYDIGQTVAASFQAPTLFTIAQDLTKMQVQADVDQSDIGRVKVDQAARFTVDAYPEEEFQGRISQIRLNATVNQNVITYPVILEVANPGERLRPLMTANVSIEVAQVKDALRVPNAALRFRPTGEKREGGGPRVAGAGRPSSGPGGSGTATAATPPGPEERAARGAQPGGGFAGAAAQLDAAAGSGKPARGGQTVYIETGGGDLKPIGIRTGITDGRFTQVVEGDLKPGDEVVVGQATSKVDMTTRPPGGRMF